MTTKYPQVTDGDGNLAVPTLFGRQYDEKIPTRYGHSISITPGKSHFHGLSPRVNAAGQADCTGQLAVGTFDRIGPKTGDATKSTYFKQVIANPGDAVNHIRIGVKKSAFSSLGNGAVAATADNWENSVDGYYIINDVSETFTAGAYAGANIAYQTAAGPTYSIGTIIDNGRTWVKFSGASDPDTATPSYILPEYAAASLVAIGANQATLAATASAVDDIYNGCFLKVTDGAGAYEVFEITDYNGTTKVATLDGTPTIGAAQPYEISLEEDCNFTLRVYISRCDADGNLIGSPLMVDEAAYGGTSVTYKNYADAPSDVLTDTTQPRDRSGFPVDGGSVIIPFRFNTLLLASGTGTGPRNNIDDAEYLAIIIHGVLKDTTATSLRGFMQLMGSGRTLYADGKTYAGNMSSAAAVTPTTALVPALDTGSEVVTTTQSLSFCFFAVPTTWRLVGYRVQAGANAYLTGCLLTVMLFNTRTFETKSVLEESILGDEKEHLDLVFDTMDYGPLSRDWYVRFLLNDADAGLQEVNFEVIANVNETVSGASS